MSVNVVSFLFGLILIFSTVQNNCEGSEFMEVINKLRAMSQGGGNPPPVKCTKGSQCIAIGEGCIIVNVQGKPDGACIACIYKQKYLDEFTKKGYVATVEGCTGVSLPSGACTKASDCTPLGNFGCAKGTPPGGNKVDQSCIDCKKAAEAISQYHATVDGCGYSQGHALNTISSYLVILGFVFVSYHLVHF